MAKQVEESPKPAKEKKRKLLDDVSDAQDDSLNAAITKKQNKKNKKTKESQPDVEDSIADASPNEVNLKSNEPILESLPEVNENSKKKSKENKIEYENVSEGNQDDKQDKKRKLSSCEAPKTLSVVKKLKSKQLKTKHKDSTDTQPDGEIQVTAATMPRMTLDEAMDKYPILKDEDLVKKFQTVPFNNNQKGRIRQRLVAYFKSTSSDRATDAINLKLEDILKQESLQDSDYRNIRVLHNMLRTAIMKMVDSGPAVEKKKNKKKNKKHKRTSKTVEENTGTKENAEETAEEPADVPETPHIEQKVKGPKRYVVFVGNLPYDVDKDAIMRHFADIVSRIKDVRIPKRDDKMKGGFAYVELADEPSYQMALSKNHSMLDNRRINVLYTTTGNTKIDKKEAKGKRAKLLAMQKSGQLLGSTPLASKRSARRKKQRAASTQEPPLQ